MFPFNGHRFTPQILLALLSLCFILTAVAAPTQPHVSLFTPQNTVKNIRQVAVRFSDPMVPFGDPTLKDPFDINCPEKGVGRWADANNWVYDFEHDLPAGVACTFTLKPGLKTAGGVDVSGGRVFRFNTGGPSIIASLPREGNGGIDAEQVFILVLDAVAKADSLSTHMYCEADGINERIPAQIIDGAERQKILAERQANELLGLLLRHRANRWYLNTIRDRSVATNANIRRTFSDRIVVARCARRLPDVQA